MAATVPSGPTIDDAQLCRALRRAANKYYGIDEACPRFPAVMPQSIDDTNAGQMRLTRYVALEKTDGVHGVLVMTRVAGQAVAAYFGRNATMYRLNMPAAACFYDGTLLEGELVPWRPATYPGTKEVIMPHPAAHRRLRFVVFEALVVAGVDLKKLSYIDRLNVARHLAEPSVSGGARLDPESLAARVAQGKLTLNHEDMWLDAKRPVAVEKAVKMVRATVQPCDGVIFAPDVPYRLMGRKWAILKKKDTDTIDFLVRFEKRADASVKLSILYTCGEDMLNAFTTMRYAGRDVRFVLKTRSRSLKAYKSRVTEAMALETTHEEVCEFVLTKPEPLPEVTITAIKADTIARDFGFEVHAAFVQPRPDKHYPNTETTITRTFLGMATSIEDVVARATRPEGGADPSRATGLQAANHILAPNAGKHKRKRRRPPPVEDDVDEIHNEPF